MFKAYTTKPPTGNPGIKKGFVVPKPKVAKLAKSGK